MQLAERRLFEIYTVDVLGHKYVFGPSRTHFNPRCARAKMSLSRAKNIFICPRTSTLLLYYTISMLFVLLNTISAICEWLLCCFCDICTS